MRFITSLAACALTLLSLPLTAHAGGLGVLGTGGVRQAPAYFYDANDVQGIDWQARPSFGFGAEGILGDKDDRILGIIRFYALFDQPVTEPDTSGEDAASGPFVYPPAHEESAVSVGAASIGIQWGLWGDPTGFQVVATTMAGTGFITSDNLEFFILEPGAGVTWTTNDRIQVFGNAAWSVRFRKSFTQGANVTAGVRYLFD